jgi:hypothetical protein
MISTVSGRGRAVGDTRSWQSKSEGDGSITIERVVENERIENSLVLMGDTVNKPITWYALEADGAGTQMEWGMQGKLDWPVGRWFGLLLPGWLGADYEAGLANLAEKFKGYEVELAPASTEADSAAVVK